MCVSLEGKRGGGVSGEGLEVVDGLAALRDQDKARVPEIVLSGWGEAPRLSEGLKLLLTTFWHRAVRRAS